VEGAGAWWGLTRITLPLIAPVLALLLLRDTIFTFQLNFVPALILTGGGPPPYATTYLPLFVYREGFEYLRYGYAAAATLVMFGITAAIVWVQWLLLRRWRASFAI
jgi:multiple sugar transport system permease protein